MASKKELFEQSMVALEEHGASEEIKNAIRAILEPKTGGANKVDLETVVARDEEGNIVAILDSVSGLWLPATEEVFYVDKTGKGIPVGDVTLKRVSKEGYTIASKHKKALAASKEAIFNDVLEGVITPDEGKAKVEELKATEPDFSSMEEMAVEVA